MSRVIPYFTTLVAFLALDAIWLTLTSGPIYHAQLADILIPGVRVLPAISFYILQTLGIQIFVLPRAKHMTGAFVFGAAFGIFTYATYDLTNWATLKDWSFFLTAIDIIWGAVVTGLASSAGHFAEQHFVRR